MSCPTLKASTGSTGYDAPCVQFDTIEPNCEKCGVSSTSDTPAAVKEESEKFSPIGIFDVYKKGLGPSSSHTNGPIAAGYKFVQELKVTDPTLKKVHRVVCDLYGSLALTGKGHCTDTAVLLGLSGYQPHSADPDRVPVILKVAQEEQRLTLGGSAEISFSMDTDMVFNNDIELPEHPNAMKLSAFDVNATLTHETTYLSIGGGFIKTLDEFHGISAPDDDSTTGEKPAEVPYPFRNARELLKICQSENMTIAEIMMENEKVISGLSDAELNERLDDIFYCMKATIDRGLKMEGAMPLSGIQRKSATIYKDLISQGVVALSDHFAIMDWVSLYARAVNEENACGGRVITAPTNGACGTVPAVVGYYAEFHATKTQQKIREFLATAAAMGSIIKRNATISGAEAGCQAEVGTACAMAAAGLTAVMGGSPRQIENAAEIGLEHNLGMTCDPLLGLVQVPCIERNSVAAIKAIASSRLALRGNGSHEVSFDSCVHTMFITGKDMQAKYRETSMGGLAIFARRSSLNSDALADAEAAKP